MRKSILAVVLVTGLLVSGTASATTYQWYQIHGSSCTSTTPQSSSALTPALLAAPSYGQYGVNAPSLWPLDVTCPMILPSVTYTYAYIEVVGYNRSSVDHLSCTITGTNYDGTSPISATAALPNNSPGYQVWTASISPSPNSTNLFVTCHLPAKTGSGYSHLTSIYLLLGY